MIKLQTREEKDSTISEFSKQLNLTYNWFNENFLNIINSTLTEFWGCSISAKLISVCENTNVLSGCEEFFVTQIRLNKELSVFLRLSKKFVKTRLENILGTNSKTFDMEKMTELEAKILTGCNDFLYKNFSHLLKDKESLPFNNTNYNECNLTFFLKQDNTDIGKIVIKIPVVAILPEKLNAEGGYFDINDFVNTTAPVNIAVGSTRIKLNDLKSLEYDDIVLLENSDISKMVLKYNGYCCDINVSPNPAIMLDNDDDDMGNFEDNGGKPMTGPDIYNMWDTIQVEIGAEFEKVKLTLGELKQISEGLVVDIGSVYDNKIDLKVEDKIVASGELVIINDRYGVKINQIFTEDKQENNAQEDVFEEESYAQEEQNEYEDDTMSEPQEEMPQDDMEQYSEENNEEVNEDDYDYSDFDVDEEDI